MTTVTSAHTFPLIQREEIAEGTMAFHFAKPSDFQFRAGQSIDLTLLNPPETDAEGTAFSGMRHLFSSRLMFASMALLSVGCALRVSSEVPAYQGISGYAWSAMSTTTSAHVSTLKKREEIAGGTMAFCFTKPPDFQFRAGQSLDLTLMDPPEPDAEGNGQKIEILTGKHRAGLYH